MSDKLAPRREKFCQEYVLDLNASAAARRAGYSADSAGSEAARLMQIDAVKARIEELKAERRERLQMDADMLLRRLVDEANADAADLYDENGDLRPMGEWPLIWRQGLVSGFDLETLTDDDGRVMARLKKVRISDRIKRLELLGKHIGVQAFKEQVEHSGKVDVAAHILEARKRAGSTD